MKLAFYEDYILVLKKKREESRRKDEFVYKFKELIPYTHITALYRTGIPVRVRLVVQIRCGRRRSIYPWNRDTSSSSSTYFAIICEGGTRKILFDFRHLTSLQSEAIRKEKMVTRSDTQRQLGDFLQLFKATVNDKLTGNHVQDQDPLNPDISIPWTVEVWPIMVVSITILKFIFSSMWSWQWGWNHLGQTNEFLWKK